MARSQFDQNETRVDLGEDLLVESPSNMKPTTSSSQEGGAEDCFQSGLILLSEGFREDAKKALRKALIHDSQHTGAREKLAEIQQEEIQEFLGKRPISTMTAAKVTDVPKEARESDLHDSVVTSEVQNLWGVDPEVVVSSEEIEQIEIELAGLSPQDRIDLGIGFLEMGTYVLALRLLRLAKNSEAHAVTAACLEATVLLAQEKYFEATLVLEPALLDSELAVEAQLELNYLMARSAEGLGQRETAMAWYSRVHEMDSEYRDHLFRWSQLRSSTPEGEQSV